MEGTPEGRDLQQNWTPPTGANRGQQTKELRRGVRKRLVNVMMRLLLQVTSHDMAVISCFLGKN